MQYIDKVVPTALADVLVSFYEATGSKWGVVTRNEAFFQPPKLHIVLLAAVLTFAIAWGRRARRYRTEAIARLATRGAGWSTKCPINTAIAYTLLACFAAQVYSKGSRPKPLVQLGWLLMPCHMTTLVWAYIFLRQRPEHYGNNCYIASLLVDWAYNPLGALLSPDKRDHQFPFEGTVFLLHHVLLALLPVYYAARYHTEALSGQHVMHLVWVSVLLNYYVRTPIAFFLGLNLGYMLSPPPVAGLPQLFHSIYYRPAYTLLFIPIACAHNVAYRFLGECLAAAANRIRRAKRKVS